MFDLDEAGLTDTALRAEPSSLFAPAEAAFLDAQVESELVEMAEDEALELLLGQEESACTRSLGSALRRWGSRRT